MNYQFSVIKNDHYALEYFFHYKNVIISKFLCPNNVKVYIFVKCKSKETILHAIYGNQTLQKLGPPLGLSMAFCWYLLDHMYEIEQTYHFYDSYHFRRFLTPILPHMTATRDNSPKNLSESVQFINLNPIDQCYWYILFH